ncbi:hypothetical protein DPA88_23650 [Salmonella enterica subsp. salamae]|nr:hypothetical protein [Salmonella enterica subsp. salamae]ECI4341049.1 hypothetical protein [Salmonella enterica subsp. salamae]
MTSAEKQEFATLLYLFRGMAASATGEERAAIDAAEAESRAYIEKLRTDYPDGSGLVGGLIAVLDTVVTSEIM